MASRIEYARGAGAGKEATGGMMNEIRELSEEEIKDLARAEGASWQMPPSGLYVFEIYNISERIEAESKAGKKYTYRQVLGFMIGKSGNLTYEGKILLKVIGTQAEIFYKIWRDSESKKCLVDIRKWNDMQTINRVYSFEQILSILQQNINNMKEAKQLEAAINGEDA